MSFLVKMNRMILQNHAEDLGKSCGTLCKIMRNILKIFRMILKMPFFSRIFVLSVNFDKKSVLKIRFEPSKKTPQKKSYKQIVNNFYLLKQ